VWQYLRASHRIDGGTSMSTTLFARSTSARLATPSGTATDSTDSAVAPFVTAAAALVPAEALIVQVAILQITTTTTKASESHEATTVITNPDALRFGFWALIGLSAIAYLAGRVSSKQKLRLLDVAGVLIAPAAYIAWSLLQSPSAFDATFTSVTPVTREVAGFVLTGLLVVLAPAFGYTVAKADPKSTEAPDANPPQQQQQQEQQQEAAV
jgi:hypothetical protein